MKGSLWGTNQTRIAIGFALAAASALMLTLAFPPYDLWYFVWIGFIPMLAAKYRLLPGKLSSLASAIAIGGWLGFYMFPIFGGRGTYMAWLPLAIGLLIYFIDKNDRVFHEVTHYRWFVLHGVAGWVGMEMLRSFIPIMGTWAFVAYPLYSQPWLIQPVSIFGIFGLGMLIMQVNYALAQCLLARFDQRWKSESQSAVASPAMSRRWLAIATVTLACWIALSLMTFQKPETPVIRVAAIQVPGRAANNRSYEQDPERRALLYDLLIEQTRAAAAQGAEIIVWHEGALNFDPQIEHTDELRALAVETQAYLVLGYMVTLPDGTWRNEAVVLDPQGEFLDVFGKDHPVVFGGERNTGLGVYPTYAVAGGKFGTMICYDMDFLDTARNLTRNGAQIIAVPSLDWTPIADKHYPHAVFRAVENRVTIIKSDGGYDSAIIDPHGRILAIAITPAGDAATLVADAPFGTGNTLNARLGDWVGWAALGTMVFFSFFVPLTLKRHKAR